MSGPEDRNSSGKSQLAGVVSIPSQKAAPQAGGGHQGEQGAWEPCQVREAATPPPVSPPPVHGLTGEREGETSSKGECATPLSTVVCGFQDMGDNYSLALCATWPRGATGPEIQLRPACQALCLAHTGRPASSGLSWWLGHRSPCHPHKAVPAPPPPASRRGHSLAHRDDASHCALTRQARGQSPGLSPALGLAEQDTDDYSHGADTMKGADP